MRKLAVLLALVVVAACSSGAPPRPAAPTGDNRFLIDPRIGFEGAVAPAIDRRFDDAWNAVLSGNAVDARKRLADIRERDPGYLPAHLAEVALRLREQRLDEARKAVEEIRTRTPRYTAAEIYEAEIALAQKETRRALDLYRGVAQRTEAPPFVRERLADIERMIFDQLYHQALSAPNAEAVGLLREALLVQPGATAARLLLTQKLIVLRQFDEARKALDPLLSSAELDRTEVQEALAEIDVGRGRYEEALVRYERLSRRDRDPRFARRLDEVKLLWSAVNMPVHFRRALESPAVTRADFAILLYWTVASVRFANNVGSPPIATDIDVAGREEIIRAIALGILVIDPVTRRVDPARPLTTVSLARLVSRTLTARGAPCSRGVASDPSELVRAQRILAACGLTDPTAGAPADAAVTGPQVAALLAQVEKVLGSG